MPHYFTVQEANDRLREIRPLMEEIQAIRATILKRQPEIWPLVESVAGNGGSKQASQLVKEFERLDRLVHLIQEKGATFKDLNLGLIDFPAWREDHEVCLCWKYGEMDLAYWHEIEAGFAGRQPIDSF
jgi:hypothetical protein